MSASMFRARRRILRMRRIAREERTRIRKGNPGIAGSALSVVSERVKVLDQVLRVLKEEADR